MKVICTNCHNVSETEVELAVGQHVICPFCKVKFSYEPPKKPDSLWQKFKQQPRGKQVLIVCGILVLLIALQAIGVRGRGAGSFFGDNVEEAAKWYYFQLDDHNLDEVIFDEHRNLSGMVYQLYLFDCGTRASFCITLDAGRDTIYYPRNMTKSFARTLIEKRIIIERAKRERQSRSQEQ